MKREVRYAKEQELKEIFGRRFSEKLGKERGNSARFARALDVSEGNIRDWKAGRRLPYAILLPEMAKYFRVTIEWLLGADEQEGVMDISQYPEDLLRLFEERMWSEEKTEEVEHSSDNIWVVSPDFRWEYTDPKWSEIIINNIVRNENIRVRQIYPKDREGDNESVVARLISDLESKISSGPPHDKRVHYLGIEEEGFLWYTEHVLYEPFGGNDQHCILVTDYIEFSVSGGKAYNFELGKQMSDLFRKHFIRVWNKHITDEYWRIDR